MRIGFIGAGRVGCTFGKYFREHGIEVSGYYNRTAEKAKEAAEESEAYKEDEETEAEANKNNTENKEE